MQKRKKTTNKRTQSIAWLCVVVLLMATVSTLAITGGRFGPGGLYILKTWGSAMNLSMDLEGGVYTEYRGLDDGEQDFEAAMAAAVPVLQSRLEFIGFTEFAVLRVGADRIRVEIPEVSVYSEVFSELYVPAKLEFFVGEDKRILDGSYLINAAGGYNESSEPVVQFEFNDEGRALLAEGTADSAGQMLTVKMDGVTVSSATLSEAITLGKFSMGVSSVETALQVAALARSGALDLSFERTETARFGSRMGMGTMKALVLTFAAAMALAVIFLLARYRVSGLVASLSLSLDMLALLFILAASGVQVTLAGMLGIGLALILALVANIALLERIREESGKGRALLVAIKNGFQGAGSMVTDAHMCLIIVALSLMILGANALQSFAHTLAIGALVSLFGAAVVTRVLMRLFVNIGGNNPKLYVG